MYIYIWKVHNEYITLEETAFKADQKETNEVISKMADFDVFWHKNGEISRTACPIKTNNSIIFICKSRSIQWFNLF